MHPNDAKWRLDAFEDATKKPFGYLVLDHHPTSSRDMRVITNILPNKMLIVYIKRDIKSSRKALKVHFLLLIIEVM